MNVSIVYEDENFLVINKPAGLIVHPKNLTDQQPSVTEWVHANYSELKGVGEPFDASGKPSSRYGIVHRLDKDTSGLLIIAKNQASFEYFKNLFQNHQIQKKYLALVIGTPKEKSGRIELPLGRLGMKRTTKLIGKKMIDSKSAVTEYKMIKKYRDYSLLEVTPRTGRTHQIRVHLKSLGTPVAGDPVYGFKESPLPAPPRLFLHAYQLSFKTPDGQSLALATDLPDDLQNFLKVLEYPD